MKQQENPCEEQQFGGSRCCI